MKTYECPGCRAEYAVIQLDAPSEARHELACVNCGDPFPTDGLPRRQYTMLKRPFDPARDDPANPLPVN